MEKNVVEKLARDMIDGVIKQANIDLKSDKPESVIDPETKRKLIEREIKMASDPDYELGELAKQSAAKRMRDILSRGGTTMTEEERRAEEKRKADEELREKAERIAQAKALYTSCIEAGGDPKRCAEIVAGLIPSPQVAMMAPPATSITELVQALTALDALRGSGGKTDSFTQDLAKRYLDNIDSQLRTAVESKGKIPAEVEVLRNEISSLREEIRQSSDPIESARRVKSLSDALRDAGVIPEATTGEPIEHLKEKHRHEEKLEEIKVDKEYKQVVAKTFSEMPERVGRGIASQISGEEEGGEESSFETKVCECGHKIVIPPEAGPTITCGACGAIYERKREEPTETK